MRHFENCDVTVINYDDFNLESISNFDKIILSPGPGLPKNYPKTLQLIKEYHQTKSILGVCLGHQAICSYFGADLYNLGDVIHGIDKEITLHKKSELFNEIPSKSNVGLYHSWAVDSSKLADEIIITSTTKENTVMSMEHKNLPIYGIQFHPESFLTEYGIQLLRNFVSL